jgi:transcriptional regulator with XRE-family HTH domain
MSHVREIRRAYSIRDALTPKAREAVHLRVAQRIESLSQALALTDAELAKRTAIDPTLVRRYRQGLQRVSPRHLVALAAAFGVSISSFFDAIGTYI